MKLTSILDDISDPNSPNYRQWLTIDQVNSYTANDVASEAVVHWLAESNIHVSWQSVHSGFIGASAPIHIWEKLLNTTFYHCHDNRRSKKQVRIHRSQEYWIPLNLKNHISAIFNTVQVPPLIESFYESSSTPPQSSFGQLAKSYAVSVSFINQLYNVPSNIGDSELSQAVIETANEKYSPKDLNKFQLRFSLTQQNAVPVNGGNVSDCSQEPDTCGEGNQDIQYIMGIAQKTKSLYWYSSGEFEDPFLSWILTVANTTDPPSSNSISWGAPEQAISLSVLNGFNYAALRLSLVGVTIVVASGAGVAGVSCSCSADSSSSTARWSGTNSWSGVGYFPSFPASSPYVTAVGSTMGPEIGGREVGCEGNQVS